jgi:sphingolipid 4-desaturase/C4-monooxygenase
MTYTPSTKDEFVTLGTNQPEFTENSFLWTKQELMHDARRRVILEKYPEIRDLYGSDYSSAIFCTCSVLIQFLGAYLARDADPVILFTACFVISGTINHTLMLSLHEISHNLFFESPAANKWFSFFANLPHGVPIAATFKRYHTEHHWGLAVDSIDQDLPTNFEARYFYNAPLRALWLLLQPFFYGLRPVVMRPKNVSLEELINTLSIILFDFAVIFFLGPKSLFYLIGGSFLGLGWNPVSGHFIAEHFVFFPGQETSSYYGPLNAITYNVGYHIEHHDFPRIPCSKLPLLKTIAPEFYDLPAHYSWTRVLSRFIISGSLFSRYRRKSPSGN